MSILRVIILDLENDVFYLKLLKLPMYIARNTMHAHCFKTEILFAFYCWGAHKDKRAIHW